MPLLGLAGMFFLQGNKGDPENVTTVYFSLIVFFHQYQFLGHVRQSHRYNQSAPGFELLYERVRDMRGGCRHENGTR